MAKLREPVSLPEAATLLLVVAGVAASLQWLGAIPDPLTWCGSALVLAFLVQPVSTLVHELGHAGAVAVLANRPSLVVVGRGPWVTFAGRRARVRFSCLPARGS